MPGVLQLLQAGRDHHRNGRVAQAEALYRQVLARSPEQPEALNLLGLIALQAGDAASAAALFGRAVRADGKVAGYHSNLGNALVTLGQPEQAIAAFRAAIARDGKFAEAHYNLGRALGDLGDLDAAIASYRRAIAARPDLPEAYYNLGIALGRQGRMADAVPAFRKATSLRPDYADAWCNLGFAWQSLARPDDAVAAFTKALACQPGLAGALGNLELALLAQGRHEEALESSRRPMTTTVQDAWAFSARLFALQNLAAYTPAERTALAREYALRFAAASRAPSPVHANPPDPGRRLRIGYVSPNLNYHSVAFFLEPILAHHDKAAVEVFCYSDNARHDEVSERLRQHADHWCRSAGWPDQRLADRIRADGIDVLVDLAGHTLDNRLLVFARRPAPVQFTYLGYPATTGLDSIHFRLVTADTDPPGAESWHSEALWRLPGSLWCYRPRAGSPPPSVDAPASRLGCVTFGSSNNVAKLSPDALALWARILGAVPSSRLVMTGIPEGSVRDRLRQRFAAQGIDPARVTIHGRLPIPDFEALCRDIDIGLDPFPYNGTTTTCELLWLGVPVVTLAGETSVARSGVAILRALGLDELVAADAEAYVALATGLAADLPRLATLRAGLRSRFERSPLRDEVGLTRAIEAAYRTAWRAWCEARTPQP